jgi:hypothetical protein
VARQEGGKLGRQSANCGPLVRVWSAGGHHTHHVHTLLRADTANRRDGAGGRVGGDSLDFWALQSQAAAAYGDDGEMEVRTPETICGRIQLLARPAESLSRASTTRPITARAGDRSEGESPNHQPWTSLLRFKKQLGVVCAPTPLASRGTYVYALHARCLCRITSRVPAVLELLWDDGLF